MVKGLNSGIPGLRARHPQCKSVHVSLVQLDLCDQNQKRKAIDSNLEQLERLPLRRKRNVAGWISAQELHLVNNAESIFEMT